MEAEISSDSLIPRPNSTGCYIQEDSKFQTLFVVNPEVKAFISFQHVFPTPSSADVKERVEPWRYSPSLPPWQFIAVYFLKTDAEISTEAHTHLGVARM